MQGIISRHLEGTVKRRLQNNPAVAILGPRQCGKTTLAGQIIKKFSHSVYLDLENPGDLAKLSDPLAFFSLHNEDLVCLDEIQRFSIKRFKAGGFPGGKLSYGAFLH